MKSLNKSALALAACAAIFCAQIAGFATLHTEIKSVSGSAPANIRYETVSRFGEIDTDGTLFIAPDGNLYAVDAQYPADENEFLLKFDTRGTADKTDDEILEVWTATTPDFANAQ